MNEITLNDKYYHNKFQFLWCPLFLLLQEQHVLFLDDTRSFVEFE